MPRELHSYSRGSNIIQPNYVYVIATEGDTEQLYFSGVKNDSFCNNIEIALVPNEENGVKVTESSPRQTFKFLQLYDKENRISKSKNKELWLLTDQDRWRNQIDEVYNKCQSEGYNFALSNPCFELWLLLHHRNIESFTPEEQVKIFRNKKVNNEWKETTNAKRHYIEKLLINICGSYYMSRLKCDNYIQFIQNAIDNSLGMLNKEEAFPTTLGTQVGILLGRIIDK